MTELYPSQVQAWLNHIHELAENIGPRGSTRPAERRAAEYCAQVYRGLGLEPQIEAFRSAVSIFHPHLLAGGAIFIAFTLYPLIPLGSALLALAALVSDLLELSFIPNPLRWIVPKAKSQNTVACVEPSDEHRRDLVLIGHLDSQRTPLIFRTAGWLAFYKAFTTAAFVIFAAQTILYFLGAIFRWPWVWVVSLPGALAALVLVAICVEADLTPFTTGANDNATAAGLLLALAEHLRSEPLQHTRVWFVNTGCEEVQHYGAIDFFKRHVSDLHNPAALVFEMLGCAGPAWLEREGIVVPFHAAPKLLGLVERLAAENPGWGAYPTQLNGGNTEMADALRVGVPAITLIGAEPDGALPYWHQRADTVDKMKPEVLARAYAMTWTIVRALDAGDLS